MTVVAPQPSLPGQAEALTGDTSRMAVGAGMGIDDRTADAARQFEQLIVQQLFQILRNSLPNGGLLAGEGPGTQMYGHMMDTAISESLTEQGGIGIQQMLRDAMMGRPQSPTHEPIGLLGTRHIPFSPGDLPSAPRNDGARSFRSVAAEMINRNSALRWAREGQLLPDDLNSDFASEGAEGVSAFNVRDAGGYANQYKCNLFAFEFVRRAGYQVPLMGRYRGWGYPEPNTVTADAEDGTLRGSWGRVATGASVRAYNEAIGSGERAYMLTGSGLEGRSGHMGVIERIHDIQYDAEGAISQIVFDGWEARPDGARHLTERTWNRRGTSGGHDVRGGLGTIEIIELRTPAPGERPELPTSHRAGASVLDNLYSRSDATQPNDSSEENR